MPKVKRKLTKEERAERIAMLSDPDFEDEFDEPDPEPDEEIVVIRGNAARSLLKSLGYDPSADADEDEGEDDGEEDEDDDSEDAEDDEGEGEEVDDEPKGKVARKRISATKPEKKQMEQEPKPPSRTRYFG